VADNISANNGVKVGGAGVCLFSDGNGPGRTSDNVIIRNTLTGNGIAGVALHTHVGPNFGAPADNMDGNQIIGNYIASNLADTGDTATPGRVGININSGGGGSPVWGTVITQNTITDEDVDIAFNTPATVDIHLNDLRRGQRMRVRPRGHVQRRWQRGGELLGMPCRAGLARMQQDLRSEHSYHPVAAEACR
jgi:hypothetical protein